MLTAYDRNADVSICGRDKGAALKRYQTMNITYQMKGTMNINEVYCIHIRML